MNGFANLPKESIADVAAVVALGHYIKPTGSRITESGWDAKKSDYDFVIYDPDKTLGSFLQKSKEWELGGSGNGSEFSSYKKGMLNFILVDNKEYFNKYIAATECIKALNCKTKKERIHIFDSIFKPAKGSLPF